MTIDSIQIQNVTKVYKLYESPQSRLKEAIHPFGKKYHTPFPALTGIDLTIKRGETFAFIGRNGAGKSTLLKILAGIVTPTSGTVKVSGRVIALLELGAGFNPDLAGTENVYLYGAFHGVSLTAMTEKFREIVEFAEIGEFIDQPVRTYSSGMFVRLAFACSVHLDPDILIVDEALSVGDARFQQKCFRFIEKLKEKGTTIVLVSHDMTLIKLVSDRACLIECGRILSIGSPKDVANSYFDLDNEHQKKAEAIEAASANVVKPEISPVNSKIISVTPGTYTYGEGSGKISLIEISTNNSFSEATGEDELTFRLTASWDIEKMLTDQKTNGYVNNVIVGVSIADRFGNFVFGMNTTDKDLLLSIDDGKCNVEFIVKLPQLRSDDYLVNASLALGNQGHHKQVAWYEAFFTLKFRSSLKNVFGWMHQPYRASRF